MRQILSCFILNIFNEVSNFGSTNQMYLTTSTSFTYWVTSYRIHSTLTNQMLYFHRYVNCLSQKCIFCLLLHASCYYSESTFAHYNRWTYVIVKEITMLFSNIKKFYTHITYFFLRRIPRCFSRLSLMMAFKMADLWNIESLCQDVTIQAASHKSYWNA